MGRGLRVEVADVDADRDTLGKKDMIQALEPVKRLNSRRDSLTGVPLRDTGRRILGRRSRSLGAAPGAEIAASPQGDNTRSPGGPRGGDAAGPC